MSEASIHEMPSLDSSFHRHQPEEGNESHGISMLAYSLIFFFYVSFFSSFLFYVSGEPEGLHLKMTLTKRKEK